ncbi:MAG TPA: hypothetical protein VNA20_16975 [Frankiaceae bacterium]|nr:hypothetical protein [Frankiaceae bacterium]
MTSLVYLLGYPAVGKYTVARALADRTGAVVVDNMVVNAPIFTLLRWDGRRQVPDGTMERIEPIRDAVLSALADLAPRDLSYVLTNVVPADAESVAIYERVRAVAATRGAVFVPVLLTCDPAEQRRRVPLPDRTARLKISDPDQVAAYVAAERHYVPGDPNLLVLDTTSTPPADTAAAIVRHLAALGA